MTFDEIWSQTQGLPKAAKQEVPWVLSEKTKRKLSMKSPAEVTVIVTESIKEIDHGSVERLDELIKKRMSRTN